jgi:hypothetical protein
MYEEVLNVLKHSARESVFKRRASLFASSRDIIRHQTEDEMSSKRNVLFVALKELIRNVSKSLSTHQDL